MKRVRELRRNPGKGDIGATPRGLNLWDCGRRETFRNEWRVPLKQGCSFTVPGKADLPRVPCFRVGDGGNLYRVGIRVGCPGSDMKRQISGGNGKGYFEAGQRCSVQGGSVRTRCF